MKAISLFVLFVLACSAPGSSNQVATNIEQAIAADRGDELRTVEVISCTPFDTTLESARLQAKYTFNNRLATAATNREVALMHRERANDFLAQRVALISSHDTIVDIHTKCDVRLVFQNELTANSRYQVRLRADKSVKSVGRVRN